MAASGGGTAKGSVMDMIDIDKGMRMLVLGSSGSGKTHFVTHTLMGKGSPLEKRYDFILVACPSNVNDSLWEKLLTKDGEPPIILHEPPTRTGQKEIAEAIEMYFHKIVATQDDLRAKGVEDIRSLFIIDDEIGNTHLFHSTRRTVVDQLFIRGRQPKVDVVVISQYYNANLNINIRSTNLTTIVLFPIGNKNIKLISLDHSPTGVPEKAFEMFMKDQLTRKDLSYPFLIIDVTQKDRDRKVIIGNTQEYVEFDVS